MDEYHYLKILHEQQKQRKIDRYVIIFFITLLITILTLMSLLYAGYLL
jgi:IS4 transposase